MKRFVRAGLLAVLLISVAGCGLAEQPIPGPETAIEAVTAAEPDATVEALTTAEPEAVVETAPTLEVESILEALPTVEAVAVEEVLPTLEPDLVVEAVPTGSAADSGKLEVYFLALSRVDGILIRQGEAASFIDVGFDDDAKPAIQFLQGMGVDHLDSYIGTHGHFDHIGGGPEIIETFRPQTVYVPHKGVLNALQEYANSAQRSIISGMDAVILKPGDTFQIGGATMTCLGPLNIAKVSISSTEENKNSLILRLDYGERSFLFNGDTTDSVLRSVAKAYPGMLDVDVLKNPHHNGQHDDDVISLISPKYVVFCTDNDSQPTSKYKRALRKQGAELYITGSKNQGHVGMVTDGHEIEVRLGYAVESLALPPDADMYVGQTASLKCTVSPSNALSPGRQLGWSSSDNSVVKVSQGKLQAVAPGETTISAAAVNGVTATMSVRVYSAVVAIDHSELRLGVGDSQKLRVKVKPDKVKDITGEWVSEDDSVAVVFNGTVTGVSEGETRVIARLSNGQEAVCTVTVGGVTPKSVKLDKRKATLKVGDTLALTATVKPAEYDIAELEWRSSDESVLWVDANGNVTAVSKGKAKVAAIASEKVYDVCAITVKD